VIIKGCLIRGSLNTQPNHINQPPFKKNKFKKVRNPSGKRVMPSQHHPNIHINQKGKNSRTMKLLMALSFKDQFTANPLQVILMFTCSVQCIARINQFNAIRFDPVF
jgi:hypothetical protein